jgi:hypothetical protein
MALGMVVVLLVLAIAVVFFLGQGFFRSGADQPGRGDTNVQVNPPAPPSKVDVKVNPPAQPGSQP